MVACDRREYSERVHSGFATGGGPNSPCAAGGGCRSSRGVSPGRASGTLRRLSVSKPDRIGREAPDRIAPESCMQSIEQRVRKFLRETYPVANETELSSEQSLLDSGVLDSIGVLNLMTWLEREFDIYVEDHEVIPENIDGIGSLVRYVESKRAEAGLTG